MQHLQPTVRLSAHDRAAVLHVLGRVCVHTAVAITPYHSHPQLLPLLLARLSQTEDAAVRLAAAEVTAPLCVSGAVE